MELRADAKRRRDPPNRKVIVSRFVDSFSPCLLDTLEYPELLDVPKNVVGSFVVSVRPGNLNFEPEVNVPTLFVFLS